MSVCFRFNVMAEWSISADAGPDGEFFAGSHLLPAIVEGLGEVDLPSRKMTMRAGHCTISEFSNETLEERRGK